MSGLQARPTTIAEAKAFVERFHRHHKPPVGHKFTVGCEVDGELVGVAVTSRPVARMLDDGYTAEVTRVCTDGTRNACSFLLSRCRTIAKAMGYRRVVTYTLPSEGGASLRAAGWRETATSPGGEWSRPSRTRKAASCASPKTRWEATL